MKTVSKNPARSAALLGMLGALAVLLSWIENALPPFPFLPPGGKAGFSNILTMYAAGALGLADALCIVLIKAFFTLATRGVSAFLMSLCGGLLSVLVMAAALKSKSPFGCVGVGIAGAAAHQGAQFCVSLALIGNAAVFYLPFMLIMAVTAGCTTGGILYAILPVLERLTAKIIKTEP